MRLLGEADLEDRTKAPPQKCADLADFDSAQYGIPILIVKAPIVQWKTCRPAAENVLVTLYVAK